MTWKRHPDGRLLRPFHGLAGAGKSGVVLSETEYLAQDGLLLRMNDLVGPQPEALVGAPREGEWWETRACDIHQKAGETFQWDGRFLDVSVRLACRCLVPTFAPGALAGPTGLQG